MADVITCEFCGTKTPRTRSNKKYCSKKCGVYAWRAAGKRKPAKTNRKRVGHDRQG